MAADIDRNDDLIRLNAFVDGELSPAERAAVAGRLSREPGFARAHATLARLKACVHGDAAGAFAPALPAPTHRGWRVAVGWAAAAVAVAACLMVATVGDLPVDHAPVPALSPEATNVALASLPSRPVLPRLDTAGLKLVGIAVNTAEGGPAVVASYLGPHGCRLDLRAGPAGRDMPAVQGSSRHRWTVDDIAYELVAHGMPGWRFALISDAAELQTRSGRLPHGMERRLREARSSAPPCTG